MSYVNNAVATFTKSSDKVAEIFGYIEKDEQRLRRGVACSRDRGREAERQRGRN